MNAIRFFAVLFAAIVACACAGEAFARGGAANLMSSPGYQRRLQESREQYRRDYYGQPYIKPPSVYPGRKWRHRGTRYRH